MNFFLYKIGGLGQLFAKVIIRKIVAASKERVKGHVFRG